VLRKYKSAYGDDLLRENNLTESTMVDQWLDVEAHHYDPIVFPISYNSFVLPKIGGTGDQKIIDTNLEKLKKILEVYEERLSKTKYLAGDFVSLADLSHFAATYYFMASPYANLFDNYPHVKAWWENLMSRPSLNKAATKMFPVA
jgi:glutathione S-transferase